MKILFFTEISPFPVNGGERIRSYGLLKALSELDHSVVAIIQNCDKISLSNYGLKNVRFIEYTNQSISRVDNLWASYYFKLDQNVISIFNEEVTTNRPDIAILDFFLAGRYYRYFKKEKIPFIIGTHNYESNLIWQRPSKSIFHFCRKIQLTIYMKIHERIFYKHCKSIITVSEQDTVHYSKFIPSQKIFMIPNFLDESRYLTNYEKENYIAMTANFGPFMNFEGLQWLINDIWDDELNQTVELKIIGKQSKEAFHSIKKGHLYNNITAIGEVDNMLPYINKAKLILIPLLHGSGTRLKCLEAMALKTPIISTSKGAEGIKSKNIYIADTSEDFRNAIKQYNPSKEIGLKLYEEFIEEYSLQRNILRIRKMLE